MQSHHLAVNSTYLFLFLLSFSLVSAIGIDNPDIPLVRNDPIDFPDNFTANISVDSASNWDTDDHGQLSSVGSLLHNWLGGLQGGSSGEYYHLNSSVYTYILSNVFNWVTESDLTTALANIHDQDLNTTDDVQFNSVDVTTTLNANHINVSTINGTTGYFDDMYLSNSTLYIGETISLSASGAQGSVLNVSGGNVTVGDDGYYFGSAKYLRDLNLTGISFEGDSISANVLNASNFTGGNFYGTYDWTAEAPYLYFNGTYLDYNETKLREEAEVTLETEVTVVPIAGGVGSATTAALDFEIKEIDVSCTTGTNFRFEASETTSGDIIDANRKVHNDDWRIEKNYPIDDTIDLDFTSVTPAISSCTVTIKYLNNFA